MDEVQKTHVERVSDGRSNVARTNASAIVQHVADGALLRQRCCGANASRELGGRRSSEKDSRQEGFEVHIELSELCTEVRQAFIPSKLQSLEDDPLVCHL